MLFFTKLFCPEHLHNTDFYHKYVTEKGNTIYKMSNIMLMLTAMLPPIEDKPVSFALLL